MTKSHDLDLKLNLIPTSENHNDNLVLKLLKGQKETYHGKKEQHEHKPTTMVEQHEHKPTLTMVEQHEHKPTTMVKMTMARKEQMQSSKPNMCIKVPFFVATNHTRPELDNIPKIASVTISIGFASALMLASFALESCSTK